MGASETGMWSRFAGVYDLQLALERRALRTTLAMLAVRETERLLDVATGTGGVLRELGERARRPARAVGIDGSEAMLERARAALPESAELIRADAAELPFADFEFEVATCAYLLHLLEPPRRAAVLSELARVLAPGGRLGVITVAPPRGPLARALSLPVRALAGRSGGPLSGLRPLDPRSELATAGFRVRDARRTSLGYPSLCVLAIRP